MAKLTKKGHCPVCGEKYLKGWGSLCKCPIPVTLPEGGKGVGGSTSGAALKIDDLPKAGQIVWVQGRNFRITNVKSNLDGPVPEVSISATLIPSSAPVAPPAPGSVVPLPKGVGLDAAALDKDSKLERARRRMDMERDLYEAERRGLKNVAAALRAGLADSTGPRGTLREAMREWVAREMGVDPRAVELLEDHATRELIVRVISSDGAVTETRMPEYGASLEAALVPPTGHPITGVTNDGDPEEESEPPKPLTSGWVKRLFGG